MTQSEIFNFLPLVFAGVACAAVALLLFGRSKLVAENTRLSERLTAAEAALSLPRAHQQEVKSTKKERPQAETQAARELLSARKEAANLRDETKRLAQQLRAKDTAIAEAKQAGVNEIHVLNEQVKALTEQLRATPPRSMIAPPQSQPQRTLAPDTTSPEARDARLETQRAREKLSETEERMRNADAKARELAEKLAQAQAELRRWKEAGATADGKVLSPALFMRWKERALEGRRMYQLMRQLRDLSDAKLAYYQSAVEALARHLLHKEAGNLPQIPSGKVAADVLLAAAAERLDLAATLPAEAELRSAPL